MRKQNWLITIVATASLACTTSGTETATPETEKACDEAYQVCSEKCRNEVDNNMCAQECIDVLRKCTKRVGD